MFRSKPENKFINKIHKRTLRLIYDTKDATFEDVLEQDKSRTFHEEYIHKLLVKVYKSINYVSPPIMWDFLNLKRNRCKLRGNYLLSCLARVLANMAHKPYASKKVVCGIRFQTNIKIWILSKNSRIKSNNGILLPVAARFVNRRIFFVKNRS